MQTNADHMLDIVVFGRINTSCFQVAQRVLIIMHFKVQQSSIYINLYFDLKTINELLISEIIRLDIIFTL